MQHIRYWKIFSVWFFEVHNNDIQSNRVNSIRAAQYHKSKFPGIWIPEVVGIDIQYMATTTPTPWKCPHMAFGALQTNTKILFLSQYLRSPQIKIALWGVNPNSFYFFMFWTCCKAHSGDPRLQRRDQPRQQLSAAVVFCSSLMDTLQRGLWNWSCCGRKAVTDCGCGFADITNCLFRLCQDCGYINNHNHNVSLTTSGCGWTH